MILDAAKSVQIESEVARRGGLHLRRSGGELVGPCIKCGGHDRFAVSTRKQVFVCRGCGAAGDVIAFVQHVDGVDFRTAVRRLAGFDGVFEKNTPTSDRGDGFRHRRLDLADTNTDTNNRDRALQLWHDARGINRGTVVAHYLHKRGLKDIPGPDVLRALKGCPFRGERYLCLISLYRNIITNEPQAIGRTAIDGLGNKIGRMTLGPTKGAAIKVDDDTDVEHGLTIGEGLETVLAARQLGFKPAWALGSAGAIRTFPVLAGVGSLTIITDNDLPDQRGREAGQEAALACSERWTAEGVEVHRIIPRRKGADMADVATQEVRYG